MQTGLIPPLGEVKHSYFRRIEKDLPASRYWLKAVSVPRSSSLHNVGESNTFRQKRGYLCGIQCGQVSGLLLGQLLT